MDARDATEVTRKTEPAGLSARASFMLIVVAALLMLVFGAQPVAQAKRLASSQTTAKQSPSNTSREVAGVPHAAPAVMPAVLPSAHAALPAAGLGGAAAASSGSRWLAPVAGLAAGLGLASMAGGAGIDEELMSGVLFAVLAAVVLLPMVFWMMARRSSGRRQVLEPSLAYAGLGQEAMVPQHYFQPEATLGSAREVPVVRPSSGGARVTAFDGQRIPAEFDASGFIREARAQFLRLQAAHDAGDLDRLRDFTTADLFARIQAELAANGPSGPTGFPVLDVQLLGVSSNGFEQIASVRFRGSSRLARDGEAELFDEVWSLSRPLDAHHGWVLAGIQPLR